MGQVGNFATVSTLTSQVVVGVVVVAPAVGGTKAERNADTRGIQVAHFAKKLWSKKKFILSERELDFLPNDPKSICVHCLTSLSFDVVSNRVFWEEYKHVVVMKFNERRSNVGYTMRNEWMSKCVRYVQNMSCYSTSLTK